MDSIVQYHCSGVYSRSGRSHMRRLACNVCGGNTAVVVFFRRRFFDLTLLSLSCGFLDWHGICPITSRKPPPSIYLCVGHLITVFTTSHHHLCSGEVYSASLQSSTRSVTPSTDIERQPLPVVSRVSNINSRL